MVRTVFQEAQKYANNLAAEDKTVKRIYWFPSEEEVRLLIVADDKLPADLPGNVEPELKPFYFGPDSEYIFWHALISIDLDEEKERKKLPDNWGLGVMAF